MEQFHFGKRTNVIAALLAALLGIVYLTGCVKPAESTVPDAAAMPTAASVPAPSSAPATETDVPAPITLVDMAERTVTFEKPATRIIALAPGDCEILYAIGAGDTLIGRGEYCNYPKEVEHLPTVQTGSGTNIEQILSLAPEVVVLNTMAQTREQVAAMENAGVKTLASRAEDIAGVYEAIGLLGALTDHVSEAENLAQSMRDALDTLETLSKTAAESADKARKTVYFEVSPLVYGLWTAGSNTFMNEIAGKLNLENVFSDVEGWAEVSQEQVLLRDPDIIVTIAMYFGEGPTPEEEILQRAGWQDVAAVKAGAVYAIDSDAMARPGPRLTEAAQALYDCVYGAAKADVIPDAA